MARSSMQLAVTAAPDSRNASEGTLVEANVRARLLGIPLLKLEATIVLVPAGLTAAPLRVVTHRCDDPDVRMQRDAAWPRPFAASTKRPERSPTCGGMALTSA